jgi:hypothetical protein
MTAAAAATAAGSMSSPVLSVVEAHRAIAILSEVVDKLRFLGSITPDVMQVRAMVCAHTPWRPCPRCMSL